MATRASPRISSPPRLLSPRCNRSDRALAFRPETRCNRYLARRTMTHEQNRSEVPSPEHTSILTVPMTVWLELFYDLVFVAAILVLSAAASHLEDGSGSPGWSRSSCRCGRCGSSTTIFTNRFRTHDMTHRLLVLCQMFLVILVAMEAHEGVTTATRVYLSLTYAGAHRHRRGDVHAACAPPTPAGPSDARRRALVGVDRGGRLFSPPRRSPWPIWPASGSPASGSLEPDARRHLPDRRRPASTSDHLRRAHGRAHDHRVRRSVREGRDRGEQQHGRRSRRDRARLPVRAHVRDLDELLRGCAARRHPPELAPRWLGLHLVLQLAMAGTAIGVAKLVKTGPLDHLPSRTSSRSPRRSPRVYLSLGLIGACTRREPCPQPVGAPAGDAGGRRGRRHRRVADRLRRPRRRRRRARAWSRCSTRSCRTG